MKKEFLKKDYTELYKNICYTFKNDELLTNALSHPSLCYSRKNKCMNYERLELLGDSVLSLIVLDLLLDYYKNLDEGEIATRKSFLVCTSALAKIGTKINLGNYIYMTKGEERMDGRKNPKIIENVVESVIGAMYVDGGLDSVRPFIKCYWLDLIKEQTEIKKDPKTRLQEWTQKNKQMIPEYVLKKQSGTPSTPIFEMEVIATDIPSQKGVGKTKKDAEAKSAEKMIEYIEKNIDAKI